MECIKIANLFKNGMREDKRLRNDKLGPIVVFGYAPRALKTVTFHIPSEIIRVQAGRAQTFYLYGVPKFERPYNTRRIKRFTSCLRRVKYFIRAQHRGSVAIATNQKTRKTNSMLTGGRMKKNAKPSNKIELWNFSVKRSYRCRSGIPEHSGRQPY